MTHRLKASLTSLLTSAEYRHHHLKIAFVPGTSIPQDQLTPEALKRLRALGYIQ